MSVMSARNTELMGVFPPVEWLTLLLPYPPKAGMAIKRPPIKFATPRATSSRFVDKLMPRMPSSSSYSSPFLSIFFFGRELMLPRLFAATEDSKNPSRAMMKAVLKASLTCLKLLSSKGK